MIRQTKYLLSAISVAALLAACGGGGSSSSADVTVSGTAATGAAIAGGTVTLKCATGTASTTTKPDGTFSVDASLVTLPCVARVEFNGGDKLHSYVDQFGINNITPVTELVFAGIADASPETIFDGFDNEDVKTAVKSVKPEDVKKAIDEVKAYLKDVLGVDTADLPEDPRLVKLIAKVGDVDGDKADKVLDALEAVLKNNGRKLKEATEDVGKECKPPVKPPVESQVMSTEPGASAPTDLPPIEKKPECVAPTPKAPMEPPPIIETPPAPPAPSTPT